ncbi:MAG TPA: ABC transporter substrate-binding protein [Casimicrobiaceae bacterium]|jgi:ABC-type transport system substrate-binding protein|nr:ABC transporter substrate-binding protein [Casimicrobiaceae bacterium]
MLGLRRFAAVAAAGLCCCISLASPEFASAADPNKVLRVAFEASETGFDPVKATDEYSNEVVQQTMESLLTYDYLARPVKLVPRTAESLPEVTDGGKTYLFRVRKGIYFHPDPAFKGKRRELTAADYAYPIKRLMDPANRSPWRFLIEGKIVGLDELSKRAEKGGRFDYDAPVAGLELPDRYTLRVKLKETDYNFAYIMAMPATSAAAREVIEAYPTDTNAHPIGTGPYILKEWLRKAKIVLEANPDYREVIWDFKGSDDPRDKAAVAAMKGKRIPQIGRVEISIIEEDQSRWLAFQNKQIDWISRFGTFAPIAIPENKLAKNLGDQGIEWDRSTETEITYYAFNMQDPVVGGMSLPKIALRRAMLMAYDIDEEIRVIRKNQAIKVESPIPPGVVGHDPRYRGIIRYDPVLANQLLDYFGYKRGAGGYRNNPDGSRLVITLTSEPQAISREYDELWKKNLDAIGLRFESRKGPFSDNLKAAEACQLAMWGAAWHSDYPDGENFMQLLYGPNTHQSNNACYQSAAFDKMYDQIKVMPDSPERTHIFDMMSRQMEVDSVWRLGVTRYRNVLVYPWVKGYRYHPIMADSVYQYLDIDPSARRP